jgi:hypothetical protein
LALAAVELSGYLTSIENGKWETLGMLAFTSAVLIFAGINYSSIALVQTEAIALQLRWWLLFGSLALLAVSIAMVAFGWSIPTAMQGGVWGTLLVLFVYTAATAMASGGLRAHPTVEMWPGGAVTGQAKTLISQMNDFSRWKAGVNGSLDVTIVDIDSPALRWILRDWPVKVSTGSSLAGTTPSIVISTSQFASAGIETTYRGQDFTLRTYPAWEQGMLSDWLRWSILHEFPRIDEKLILWVRNDVFIDSQNNQ